MCKELGPSDQSVRKGVKAAAEGKLDGAIVRDLVNREIVGGSFKPRRMADMAP